MVIRSLIVIVSLIAATPSWALRDNPSYACLAEDSTAVIIVEIKGTEKASIYSDRISEMHLTELQFITTLRGEFISPKNFGNKFKIISRPHPDWPNYANGTVAIIFLDYSDNGPYVIGGSKGLLPLSHGYVMIEGKKIDLKTFLKELNKGCNRNK